MAIDCLVCPATCLIHNALLQLMTCSSVTSNWHSIVNWQTLCGLQSWKNWPLRFLAVCHKRRLKTRFCLFYLSAFILMCCWTFLRLTKPDSAACFMDWNVRDNHFYHKACHNPYFLMHHTHWHACRGSRNHILCITVYQIHSLPLSVQLNLVISTVTLPSIRILN